ncbi:hypothetical protein EMQ_1716 [Acetobacter aceti NBRC 14818]|uniref:Uncharacterized protein n=2 Tax=Acetobacter aceti TaxID=435 RepID=A0A6S6PPC5_ACEAC|nr:hypothetical protein AAJCM20276_31550 [Acetobacter aceti]BCK76110.1 hypothetical protein EMQ_1716 [Acetobacter aceti NBRC 14818]
MEPHAVIALTTTCPDSEPECMKLRRRTLGPGTMRVKKTPTIRASFLTLLTLTFRWDRLFGVVTQRIVRLITRNRWFDQ